MSAPTSRAVHPCVTSVFDGSRGAEYSTWAYLTTRPPQCPNLVTAQASTVRVYTLDEDSGKLFETYVFPNLAGNICYMETLRAPDHGHANNKGSNSFSKKEADSLLLGFCGHPRMTIVTVTPQTKSSPSPALLSATSLLDLTQALIDNSYGTVTPLEHDLVAATVERKNRDGATVGVILGAGVAVAVVDLQRCSGGWLVGQPYLLPLPALHTSIKQSHSAKSSSAADAIATSASAAIANTNVASIATGFGDILAAAFLTGYIEPTLVLLHSNPDQPGRTWTGRLGRPHWQPGTRHGLLVTAISVTVTHRRSAVLWSIDVPADARALYAIGKSGCLVLCSNSLLSINNAGRVEDFLAVNGFARSTCPTKLLEMLKPNPKPYPKLAIQLDGSALTFCSDNTVLLSLRSGKLYLLQLSGSGIDSEMQENAMASQMTLLPLGHTLGALGNVANLISWPLDTAGQSLFDKFAAGAKKEEDAADTEKTTNMNMGLLFAGSRLGDSSLLGFALEEVTVTWWADSDAKRIKPDTSISADSGIYALDNAQSATETNNNIRVLDVFPTRVTPEIDAILRLEEDALYAPTIGNKESDGSPPNIVPPSDEESSNIEEEAERQSGRVSGRRMSHMAMANKRKESSSSIMVVLRALTALDSLIGLGPLGPSCEGPIDRPHLQEEINAVTKLTTAIVPGDTAVILPCGYGSSGGISIVTVPGRDDRSIMAEEDCLEVECVFSLREQNLVFLGMKSGGGTRVLRVNPGSRTGNSEENIGSDMFHLTEVNVHEWFSGSSEGKGRNKSTSEIFSNTSLLGCADFVDGSFAVALSYPKDPENQNDRFYGGAVLREASGQLSEIATFAFPDQENYGRLATMAPITIFDEGNDKTRLVFACSWSSGAANLFSADHTGVVHRSVIKEPDTMDVEPMDDADSERAINSYYASMNVVAVDLFRAPSNFFDQPDSTATTSASEKNKRSQRPSVDSTRSAAEKLLEDDHELYYIADESDDGSPREKEGTTREVDSVEGWKDETLFLASCRQGGLLEIFKVSDCFSTRNMTPVWSCEGCGLGSTCLSNANIEYRTPRLHEVCVSEIRFFFCGPTGENGNRSTPSLCRPLCFSVETSAGDLIVYSAEARRTPSTELCFHRVALKLLSRESQEQARFHAKLRRKGIVDAATESQGLSFRYNVLHRFMSISQQDGLFAATCRPVWLVAERGNPEAIAHRSRYAAPAGGKPRPISGFCGGLDADGAFLTLHERVGRVGSQRLTVHRGISSMFKSEGLLPGGGLCLEKVPLGVTVRRIQFIDDASVSGRGQCLYAVLVSREVEADTSHLNDDGMTLEERERVEQEKEAAKIKRQVEADLGGFDVEQEWVEEIEREDCFQVDRDLGGSPPMPQSSYSVWIVDAANRWMVVDSYELGEFEHGLTMRVMSLTEFPEEPGSASSEEIPSEDMESKLFITVGVGIVDKNGEDVSSRGRVLLFEVKAPEDLSLIASSQMVELALVYEKDIFHGPVTSLSCLISEGKNRLVVGAGADVNVEQWGNGKLTQVGFFRATMQVLDIFMFKNFLLLSDAYDSLYFLVWRESDKSLTLLSKEYDPLAVYAAGTMSRAGNLTFVCQDDRQNLQFFQYAPGEAAARGGNKLVCRADFHLGSQTSAFHNHVCRSSLWINSATPSSTLAALKQQDNLFGRSDDDQRLGTHFGTSDGGFHSIVPLSEPVYWRLTGLQSVMANALESDCALSQRAWRLYRRSYRRGGCRSTDRKKGVIDGDLVMKYADLPLADQEDLASAIGSTVELILDNLLEIKCASMVI